MFEIQINRLGIWYTLTNGFKSRDEAQSTIDELIAQDKVNGDELNFHYQIVNS